MTLVATSDQIWNYTFIHNAPAPTVQAPVNASTYWLMLYVPMNVSVHVK